VLLTDLWESQEATLLQLPSDENHQEPVPQFGWFATAVQAAFMPEAARGSFGAKSLTKTTCDWKLPYPEVLGPLMHIVALPPDSRRPTRVVAADLL
jgi:hypothetical protein